MGFELDGNRNRRCRVVHDVLLKEAMLVVRCLAIPPVANRTFEQEPAHRGMKMDGSDLGRRCRCLGNPTKGP